MVVLGCGRRMGRGCLGKSRVSFATWDNFWVWVVVTAAHQRCRIVHLRMAEAVNSVL